MKPPAIRVLKSRIREVVQTYSGLKQMEVLSKDHRDKMDQHIRAINRKLAALVKKDVAKYIRFSTAWCGLAISYTDELNSAYNEITKEAGKLPREPQWADVYIASLDIHLHVVPTHQELWQDFARAVDGAFLQDDAKGIIQELELLSVKLL